MSKKPIFLDESEEKLNQLKEEICRVLGHAMYTSRYPRCELARRLRTSEANISRVINRRVDDLTFNQLFRYLATFKPKCKVFVSLV
jgi:hypothetical protein